MGLPPYLHAIVWGSFAVLVLVCVGISVHFKGQNIWQTLNESRELRRTAYAERIYLEHVFRTRANTWSNLAFVLVGFYALAFAYRDLRCPRGSIDSYLNSTPTMSLVFGAACCSLGLGSGLYHASLTRWGQQLDVASMYPPLLACLIMSAGRWLKKLKPAAVFSAIPASMILSVLLVVTSFLLYRYKWSMSSSTVLTTLIVGITCSGVVDALLSRSSLQFRWLLWSAVALVAAIVCRQLDVAGKFSSPDAWLQGHALWHVLTALSLAAVYAYHRSEKPAP